jgi:KipI family sensor histidine kinase inhibitor
MAIHSPSVRFHRATELSWLLLFSSPQTAAIQRLVAVLDQDPPPGLLELTPSYAGLLVEFNRPDLAEAIQQHLSFCIEQLGDIQLPSSPVFEIPVFYGGEFGPDLGFAADFLRMSVSEIVEAHTNQVFTVAFYGFRPGFAYLEGWPSRLALPRLESPRSQVPAGSVALAGQQCGIYPSPSPGGWRIIGRTPFAVFDPQAQSFSPFPLGSKIRFYPSRPEAWASNPEKAQRPR